MTSSRPAIATHLIKDSARSAVFAAARGLKLSCTHIASTSNLFDAIRSSAIGILVMELDDPALETLAIQEQLRVEASPISCVYLSSNAMLETVVHVMQRGAISVLSLSSSSVQIVEALKQAESVFDRRNAWLTMALDANQKLSVLTDRQRLVLERILVGQTNKLIGTELHVSIKTIEKHRQIIHEKTRTRTFPDLVRLHTIANLPLDAAFGFQSCSGTLKKLHSDMSISPPARILES
ncbi:MAG: hypothetical protein KDA91_07620 [Planctomycetaceae bacterium]|nr:hypothetical protein [Planctomycetaceae bacterium]